MEDNRNIESNENDPIEWFDTPIEMRYGERVDYYFCICGNYERGEGFNVCNIKGERIPPYINDNLNEYGLCEQCGCIFNVKKRLIIGRLKHFTKRE